MLASHVLAMGLPPTAFAANQCSLTAAVGCWRRITETLRAADVGQLDDREIKLASDRMQSPRSDFRASHTPPRIRRSTRENL